MKYSQKVLTIGPDYHNHRGGIGFLIGVYAKSIEGFKFIPSYRPFTSKIALGFYFAKQLVKVFALLHQDKEVEILHIHGSHRGSFYRKFILFLMARFFNKKVVYHLNSSNFIDFYEKSSKPIKSLVSYFMNHANAIIVVSVILKKEYEKVFPKGNFWTLPNMIEPVLEVRKSWVIHDKIVFLFLGRIGENDRKGAFLLLETIAHYLREYEGIFEFHIGGDGEVEKLQTQIEALGLSKMVKYIGWVEEADKPAVFLASDIFILPTYHEAQPLSILEAMNYSMPIISTRVASIPEVVNASVNGFLVPPGNHYELAKAIGYFAKNKGQIKQMGEFSRMRVKKYYPQQVFSELEKIYQSLL